MIVTKRFHWEIWEIIFVLLAVMGKAKLMGVEKTLRHFPCLWLRVGEDKRRSVDATLRYVGKIVDRFFRRRIWLTALFKKRQCLARGLVQGWYAKKLGREIVLHFGVKKRGTALRCHCWATSPQALRRPHELPANKDFVQIWSYQISLADSP